MTEVLNQKQYFEHLENLKSKSNYQKPTFIFQTSTSNAKEGEVSTIEHYLFMNKNKIEEIKSNL